MTVEQTIYDRLSAGLSPHRLEVKDESALHAGHAGAREGGQSHFRIEVVSSRFEGLSRLARHRIVHAILRDELEGPVHALAMRALTPGEDGR